MPGSPKRVCRYPPGGPRCCRSRGCRPSAPIRSGPASGNPTPVLNGSVRTGDNPWTCSIVALQADTGKLVWGFQASPHDTHDWDAAEVPVLVDGMFNGAQRKMLMQASRNGYFFVLDRTNGKNLLTAPFAAVNWAKGIDKEGRPIPDPDKEPARDGRLVAPVECGATNYRSPCFDAV